jgi:hypothetical protein
MSRNKSLDEGVYGDRWRKSLTTYETSQSTESIDLSPVESHKSPSNSYVSNNNKGPGSDSGGGGGYFNGLDPEHLKLKSKSQHGGLDLDANNSRSSCINKEDDDDRSKYVSVAHIRLRDAKSEINVSGSGSVGSSGPLTQGESSDDLDFDGDIDELRQQQHHHHHPPYNRMQKKPHLAQKPNRNSQPSVVDVQTKNRQNNEVSYSWDFVVVGLGTYFLFIKSCFAAMLKGIVMILDVEQNKKRTLPRGPKPTIAPKPAIPPKPKNIKRQGHSCEYVLDENESGSKNKAKLTMMVSSTSGGGRKTTPKSTSMSVLSPVDVDKEWEHITMFMDSFNVKTGGLQSQ